MLPATSIIAVQNTWTWRGVAV